MFTNTFRHTVASETEDFTSVAWLLRGWTRSLGGHLKLVGGRISFVDALDTVHFDVPVLEVAAIWLPWYYFGGGLKLMIRGEVHAVSFVLPNHELPIGGLRRLYCRAVKKVGWSPLGCLLPQVVLGRDLCRQWSARLGLSQEESGRSPKFLVR